jgi:hypothetical protein
MAVVFERIDWSPDWQRQLEDAGAPLLRRAADDVLDAMKTTIPVSQDGSHGREPGYAKSHLKTLERGRDDQGLYRDVGTDARTPDGDSYPAMLEHGTKAHEIVPREPGYPLRDPATGRVFGYKVNHPGTKPIPWARTALYSIRGRVYR